MHWSILERVSRNALSGLSVPAYMCEAVEAPDVTYIHLSTPYLISIETSLATKDTAMSHRMRRRIHFTAACAANPANVDLPSNFACLGGPLTYETEGTCATTTRLRPVVAKAGQGLCRGIVRNCDLLKWYTLELSHFGTPNPCRRETRSGISSNLCRHEL
jgi:hypothetical protein